MNSTELLRYAIVEQAFKDYEWSLRYLQRLDHEGLTLSKSQQISVEKARRYRDECERFFRSEWFQVLCEIDGENVINMLRKRAVTEKTCISRSKIT